jgi:hypothetical protein
MSMLRDDTLPFEPATWAFDDQIRAFEWRGATSVEERLSLPSRHSSGGLVTVPTFTNEFWTAKQRAAHSLHEVSYRACFKPQLPRFFIERLTQPGDVVYDPFMGRGTTVLEAALLGRNVYGCDVNPLSRVLCEPRLAPPTLGEVERALEEVDFSTAGPLPEELLVFYHPKTLEALCALRTHLLEKDARDRLTRAEKWVRMVAVNRLTGHSTGFFSVYTLPPNQAVSVKSQARINARRNQTPTFRDVRRLILEKTRALLRDCASQPPSAVGRRMLLGSAFDTPEIGQDSVALVVTSPPFLDVVDYKTDNWLRCWFCGIDAALVPVTMARTVVAWTDFVTAVLAELRRVVRPGGYVAFEVGEVKGGAVRLEENVIPAGVAAGLDPVLVLINAQRFTKTANCWGVSNNRKGTNSNRVVVFRKSR